MNGERGRENQHRDPSPRLVIMPHNRTRLHLLLPNLMPRLPRPHPLERMDLDRVIITRRRHLPRAVERRVADTQPALVLAHQRRRLHAFLPTQFPQVPDPHMSIQRGGRDEMRVPRVQAEAADFLF